MRVCARSKAFAAEDRKNQAETGGLRPFIKMKEKGALRLFCYKGITDHVLMEPVARRHRMESEGNVTIDTEFVPRFV